MIMLLNSFDENIDQAASWVNNLLGENMHWKKCLWALNGCYYSLLGELHFINI